MLWLLCVLAELVAGKKLYRADWSVALKQVCRSYRRLALGATTLHGLVGVVQTDAYEFESALFGFSSDRK